MVASGITTRSLTLAAADVRVALAAAVTREALAVATAGDIAERTRDARVAR